MSSYFERFTYLLDRKKKGLASEEEISELQELFSKFGSDPSFKSELEQLWSEDERTGSLPELDWERIYRNAVTEPAGTVVPMLRKGRFRWGRIAAAAAVLFFFLSVGIYYYKGGQPATAPPVSRIAPANDALPGVYKATLTIANGSTIVLDSAAPGRLTQQGGIDVVNVGNGLAYNGEESSEVLYNTLTTHRGEQYALTLADGTKAWLNAASSIRFPVTFSGKERRVEITGEVYFEVAHNPASPFIVKKAGADDGLTVQVLGTHFNVNAYDDEAAANVSLLEGSVKVYLQKDGAEKAKMLKPGQQALVGNGVKIVDNADMEEVMAWKKGLFSFNHTTLPVMLRQLSRWYDVDIVYDTNLPEMKIGGGMNRNTHLSQVLTILDELKVKHRIEGKKLVVGK